MLSFKQVYPGIFHIEFDSAVDVAAHFLRFQEYYESPNEAFKGHGFQLIDYIKWYATNHNGSFSYFKDWSGFNIPAQVVLDCYEKITDHNDHDRFMLALAHKALHHVGGGRAYLIGTTTGDSGTLDHEVAHGLYHINDHYRNAMRGLVSDLPQKVRQSLKEVLREKGYHPDVYSDEIQAYMATGLAKGMSVPKKLQKPFIKVFKEFTKKP